MDKAIFDDLSPAEATFVSKFHETSNATQSYLAARPNVSPKTAGVEGCRLLKRPKVKEAIDMMKREGIDEARYSKKSVLYKFDKLSEVAENKGDIGVAVNAWDKIAKVQGHYEKGDGGGDYIQFIQNIFNGPTQINNENDGNSLAEDQ